MTIKKMLGKLWSKIYCEINVAQLRTKAYCTCSLNLSKLVKFAQHYPYCA